MRDQLLLLLSGSQRGPAAFSPPPQVNAKDDIRLVVRDGLVYFGVRPEGSRAVPLNQRREVRLGLVRSN